MKKAASIFRKSRKFITAWFDNECVATPVVLPKNILQCTRSRLTVQCWWKIKKININILIAKGGAWNPSAPPSGCAFVCWCTSEACKNKKRRHNEGHDDSLLNCNIGWKKHTADLALTNIASRFSQTLSQDSFTRKWWLSFKVETTKKNF